MVCFRKEIHLLKYCTGCGVEKDSVKYSKDSKGKNGLHSKCKDCNRLRNLKYRQANIETLNVARKALYKENPIPTLLSKAKNRAKEKHLPFSIDVDDLEPFPVQCPVLNIPITIGDKKVTDNSPTVDRIIPELGYVPDNVIIISKKANQIKNNATIDELHSIVSFLEAHRDRHLSFSERLDRVLH